MKPMDFQMVTADRIFQLFKDGQKRVLLADEVGLGKTIIASAVVKKVSDWHLLWDDHFKVIYVCSNINIANQNCGKLGIPKEDRLNFSEGRLSMQHLRLAETEGKDHSYQQLIPMTPATSFNMSKRQGLKEERALICAILEGYKDLNHRHKQLNRLMMFNASNGWYGMVSEYKDRIYFCDNNGSRYLSRMYKQLDAAFKKDSDLYQSILNATCGRKSVKVDKNGWLDIISRLRRIFAEISLEQLDPDLVIMDEFQRFKDLIDTSKQSEESTLANHFLKNENTKVLLLSATPYKPYSTLEELADGEESHYEEFMRVVNFLLPDEDKNSTFHKVWSDYASHLSELRSESFTALIAAKNYAEESMRGFMCRTERRNDAIFDFSKSSYLGSITIEDVLSYTEMQRLTNALSLGKFPIEYVKSAPYLMSFMTYYKVKTNIEKALGKERNIDEVERSKTAFLTNRQIGSYRKIPCNNARLQKLFDEAFGKGKNGAELLLWVPASRPYYKTSNVFSQNEGFSKTLVFSSWEMVPRMIAALTSYEAERLVNERVSESKKKKSYFSEKGQRIRKDASADLLKYPSSFLAKCYNPLEYMDLTLSEIRRRVKARISAKINSLKKELKLKEDRKSAASIYSFLLAMDGVYKDRLSCIPVDAEDFMTDLAIGGPSVCALRITKDETSAKAIGEKFISLFNKPESIAVLDALYPDNECFYYESVAHYCAEGNLQAVLDEYAYTLKMNCENLENGICTGIIDTAAIPVETKESFISGNDKRRLRCHFAVGYYNAKINENSIQRTENIRNGFNSPFRPFVLATTSIGQEGLDFHIYCRKVMHWNLPSNPIDLEQREGRINRYLCHAIRQNLANDSRYNQKPFSSTVWEDILSRAKSDLKGDYSDLVPYWCLPDNYPYRYHIERVVPMYPFSSDETRYARLISVLAIYRMTLGQPHQEELMEAIRKENWEPKDLEKLYMSLSPWDYMKCE